MQNKKHKILTMGLYALCGAALALPMILNNLWFLGWIVYCPVLYNELKRNDDEKPYKNAWRRGLSFFCGYGLVTFSWLWEMYPLDFAGFDPISSLFVVLLGWIGIPLVQGAVSACNFVVLKFMKRRNLPLVIQPITSAFVWICFEWVQTLTWAGIPWGKLAIGQTGMLCNIQSVSLFGSYFISFLMISVSGYLALALVQLNKTKKKWLGVLSFVIAILIFFSNFLYGMVALKEDRGYKDAITVAAIQGNVPTAEKWRNETMSLLESHRDLVIEAGKGGVDLVVLAETAFPYIINKDEFLLPYTEEIAKDAEVDMLIGCLHLDDNNKLYNSIRYVSQKNGFSDTIYNKRRPVPFGEFVPMGKVIRTILPILGRINLLAYEIEPGSEAAIFETEHGNVGSLICFDSIYETLARKTVKDGAELLAISTNDCWFQDSAAVYQHNSHAILRAVEAGRYVVRSANTGISAIITDRGEVIESLEPLVEGYIVGDVKLADYNTLYTKVGNLIVLISFIWIGIVGMILEIKRRKTHEIAQTEFKKQKKIEPRTNRKKNQQTQKALAR
jgi:apolipoprotein N-acyltransferase